MKKTKDQVETTEEQKRILSLTSKKHVKIYLLSQAGVKNGDIALLLATNQGAVGNALKEYKDNAERIATANAHLG